MKIFLPIDGHQADGGIEQQQRDRPDSKKTPPTAKTMNAILTWLFFAMAMFGVLWNMGFQPSYFTITSSIVAAGDKESGRSSLFLLSKTTGVEKETVTYGSSKSGTVLGSILTDGSKVSVESLYFLIQLGCLHDVRAHVLVKKNPDMLKALYQLTKDELYPDTSCAAIHVTKQPAFFSSIDNRIRRLQAVRDHQRAIIKGMMMDGSTDEKKVDEQVVILVDLDLEQYPLPRKVMESAHSMMMTGSEEEEVVADVLCANGVVKNYEDETESYYDLFSTVLLPDTFVYPVRGREIQVLHPDEDASLVVKQKKFTSHDLLEWINMAGRTTGTSPVGDLTSKKFKAVPVRSCFGGLALYKASKWFDERCSYSVTNDDGKLDEMMRYANIQDHMPCEHVVLNKCLQDVDPTTMVAIQPDLRTRWHKTGTKSFAEIARNYAISQYPSLQNDLRMPVEELAIVNEPSSLTMPIHSDDVTKRTKSAVPEARQTITFEEEVQQQQEGLVVRERISQAGKKRTRRTMEEDVERAKKETQDHEGAEQDDFEFWDRNLRPGSYGGKKGKKGDKKGGRRTMEQEAQETQDHEAVEQDDFDFWDRSLRPISYSSYGGKKDKKGKKGSKKGGRRTMEEDLERVPATQDHEGAEQDDFDFWDRNLRPVSYSSYGGKKDKKGKKGSKKGGEDRTRRVRGLSVNTHNLQNDAGHRDNLITSSPKTIQTHQKEPKLAWLMSFPNSGTSYTLETIQAITGNTVATNYGAETKKFQHPMTPVFKDEPNGPYWLGDEVNLPSPPSSSNETGSKDDVFVLAKTHCGGYCSGCSLKRMERTYTGNFLEECASDLSIVPRLGVTEYRKQLREHLHSYDPRRYVKKTVHLIRNPFDNIVSRYFHQIRVGKISSSKYVDETNIVEGGDVVTKATELLYDREAFRSYCFEQNEQNVNDNDTLQHFVSDHVFEMMQDVPCRVEFFKYVMWHNLAFDVTSNTSDSNDSDSLPSDVETLVVHYDDYSSEKFESTVSRVVGFLGMKVDEAASSSSLAASSSFASGKAYSHYFTNEEMKAVESAFVLLSNDRTRTELSRYFL